MAAIISRQKRQVQEVGATPSRYRSQTWSLGWPKKPISTCETLEPTRTPSGQANRSRRGFAYVTPDRVGHGFILPSYVIPKVPVFVMRTPVFPGRRCTVILTNRATRCPPMPPRSLEISVWLWGKSAMSNDLPTFSAANFLAYAPHLVCLVNAFHGGRLRAPRGCRAANRRGCQGRSKTRPQKRSKSRPEERIEDWGLSGRRTSGAEACAA